LPGAANLNLPDVSSLTEMIYWDKIYINSNTAYMKSSDMLLYVCTSTNYSTKQLNFQGAWNVWIKINFETTAIMISSHSSFMVLSLSLSLSFYKLASCKIEIFHWMEDHLHWGNTSVLQSINAVLIRITLQLLKISSGTLS
jgi:hypothetical protein